MQTKLIGRKDESLILENCYSSKTPEFIAIYGRRRVGKTFLIRQFFSAKKSCVFFNATGMQNGKLSEQIANFTDAIGDTFLYQGARLKAGKNWQETFKILTDNINAVAKTKKIVLFFDEFPWLATKNSRLMQTLEFFWNHHWSKTVQIKLVICGSSASWILKNIINNKGGLYNRVTKTIHLEPFNLADTKKFLLQNGIKLLDKQIVEIYAAIGGIPHYLEQVDKGSTAVRIIEKIAFTKNSFLLREFDNLYATLFGDAAIYIELVRKIASHRYGLEQEELANKIKTISSGGTLSDKLKTLEDAGIIASFKPYANQKKGVYYKVIDEYTNFYFHWIEPIKDTLLHKGLRQGYWDKIQISPSWYTWAGYAFEAICYKHLAQIGAALGLSPTAIPGTWKYTPKKNSQERGAQIDLLFDCDDNSIMICEIKYKTLPFKIDKVEATNLLNKLAVFKEKTKTKKQLLLAIVSANGISKSIYSEDLAVQAVALDDLFKSET